MANLKELSKVPERLAGGHRLCIGCGAGTLTRQTLLAAGNTPVVVTCATGCLEVSTSVYPYSSWKKDSFFHSAFENSAATMSGIEAAYVALKKTGKIKEKINFIAFGGDGGTYDIGLQSLSGAMERGHRMLYICYNNEAYMNTGIQRSAATPRGATTTTEPAGKVKPGKEQHRKDMTEIMVAHNIPYVAQAVVGDWNDYVTKVQKALSIDGPTFINIMQPCPLGWGTKPEDTLALGRLAVDTNIWPLYEVENGVYKINKKPKEKKSVVEFLKPQARFKHLFNSNPKNAEIIESVQKITDAKWELLLKREGGK
ncbi:MAG: thiamine pyrophosphate-dependent enzyme [Elusimicrobia bacterium]|nr:thiamine pyrophosphate-dependent enzyme [Elusimicrobiota bacterium]